MKLGLVISGAHSWVKNWVYKIITRLHYNISAGKNSNDKLHSNILPILICTLYQVELSRQIYPEIDQKLQFYSKPFIIQEPNYLGNKYFCQ